jgi:hypothetical protein
MPDLGRGFSFDMFMEKDPGPVARVQFDGKYLRRMKS